MEEFKIIIPTKMKNHVTTQQVIRISPEAYNALTDIFNESIMSMKEIASLLIAEAAKHIEYQKENCNG